MRYIKKLGLLNLLSSSEEPQLYKFYFGPYDEVRTIFRGLGQIFATNVLGLIPEEYWILGRMISWALFLLTLARV